MFFKVINVHCFDCCCPLLNFQQTQGCQGMGFELLLTIVITRAKMQGVFNMFVEKIEKVEKLLYDSCK